MCWQLKIYYYLIPCFSLINTFIRFFWCWFDDVILENIKVFAGFYINQISLEDWCYLSYTLSRLCILDRSYWLKDRWHILDCFLLLALHLPPGPEGSWSWIVGQEPPLASWTGSRSPGSWKASWSLLHSPWKGEKLYNIDHIDYYLNSKNFQCLPNVATY